MSTPRADIPYHKIVGLQPETQRQIDLDFVRLGEYIDATHGPIVVVADDGTGDFTSIKDAIEAPWQSDISAKAIYVKPPTLSLKYSDVGRGAVNTLYDSESAYYLFGPNLGQNGRDAGGLGVYYGIEWDFDGFTLQAGDGSFDTRLQIDNLILSPAEVGNGFIAAASSGTLRLSLRNCALLGTVATAASLSGTFVALYLKDTTVSLALFIGAATGDVIASQCLLGGGWSDASSTWTITPSTKFIIEDSIVQAVSCTIAGQGGSTGGLVRFARNTWLGSGTTVSLTNNDAAATYLWIGNVGGGITWNLYGSGNGPLVTFNGNVTPGWKLILDWALTHVSGLRIDGIYNTIVLGTGVWGAMLDVVVDVQNSGSVTALTLHGSGNIVKMAVDRPGANCTGLVVDGNNNIVLGGFTGTTTPWTDTGTGNKINTLTDTGAIQITDYTTIANLKSGGGMPPLGETEPQDGFPGPPGSQGPAGATGSTGGTGSAGAPGSIGPPGMEGSDGEDGFPGPPGPPGPQGIQGIPGTGGSGSGSAGPPGQDGADGADGFDYAGAPTILRPAQGPVGDASHVSQLSLDQYGDVTLLSSVPIAITQGAVSGLGTALGLLAPLASPALTGHPTGVTEAALDNSTRLASTAYADAAVAVVNTLVTEIETDLGELAPLASPALTGAPTTPDPTTPTGIANKEYVDNALLTFDAKPDVAYVSVAALPANTYANGASGVGATLTGNANGPLVIDGQTLVVGQVGELVLVTAEAASANNGWYTITTIGVVAVSKYVLTRTPGSDSGAVIGSGYLTGVVAPNTVVPGTNNGTLWLSVAAADPFVVGATALTFSKVGSAYTGSSGIILTGQNFTADMTVLAPLASPALTGHPTGVTETPLTNNTRLATTAYADLADTAAMAVMNAQSVAVAGSSLRGTIATPTLLTDALKPTGSYETFPRQFFNTTAVAFGTTSGTVYLIAIALPTGLVVTNLSFVGASACTPAHWWLSLCNSTFVTLRSTADQLTGALAINTQHTVALSSTFTTAYAGVYYIALMIAGTVGATPAYGLNGFGGLLTPTPRISFTGLTAQTTAPADGTNLATTPANIFAQMYAYTT